MLVTMDVFMRVAGAVGMHMFMDVVMRRWSAVDPDL
jgi:hypothetical protein